MLARVDALERNVAELSAGQKRLDVKFNGLRGSMLAGFDSLMSRFS